MNEFAFDVRPYDDTHKQCLASGPFAPRIQNAFDDGIFVPKQELLVYTVFGEQKPYRAWQTYKDLEKRLPQRLPAFEDYFDTSSEEIVSRFAAAQNRINYYTEAAGVGAGLAVVSKLAGLTEADWERIPVSTNKDLDFQHAVFGNRRFIEVEAKGTVSDLVDKSPVSKMKSHIQAKLSHQRTALNNNNVLLGTIAVFPTKPGDAPILYLLDPPFDDPIEEPDKYKLLARMNFYWRELGIISQAQMLSALATRISDIARIENYQRLDKLPLLRRDGEPMSFPESVWQNHSTVDEIDAFGEVVAIGPNSFFFYGFLAEIFDLLIRQSHNDIQFYFNEAANGPLTYSINGRIPKRVIRKADLNPQKFKKPRHATRHEVPLEGKLWQTSAGRVIGTVRALT